MGLTFFCIDQGFVLFRAQTFAITQAMYHRLGMPVNGVGVAHPYGYGLFRCIVAAFVLAHLAACRHGWERLSLRLPTSILGFAYVLALILCMGMAPVFDKPFLYMQC